MATRATRRPADGGRADRRRSSSGTYSGQLSYVGAPTSLLEVRASTAEMLTSLQRTAGNRAVAQLVATYRGNGNAPQVTLHGTTTPTFDGGTSQVLNPRISRAQRCGCEEGERCLTASATLQVTYRVAVVIDMPEVPSGLTPCQERRVRAFLRDVLGPHEREHARRLRTYDGTTRRAFSVKGCGREAVTEAAQAKAQEMHDTEAEQRARDADALSLAIDPFVRPIDLDC